MESLVYKKERLAGKRVMVRVDFNVEIKNGNVISDFRLKRTIPTIIDLQNAGAKIILIAHIDEKEGGSLEPVARYLLPQFPKLYFISDIFADHTKASVANMKEGDVILFENLRKWPGEKANDEEFAKYLASFADVYVNEAFSVSHRAHASIVGVPKILSSFIGNAFDEEVRHLSRALHPEKPFFFVIGGAKFETKLPLVQKFLNLADKVAVMGALANDFFKQQGMFMGDSDVSENIPKEVAEMMNNSKIILPTDVVTTYKGERFQKLPSQIGIGERMVDAGEKTVRNLKSIVMESNFILWNGPLGKSDAGFAGGTESFAKAIVASKKTAIVGGGDVVAAIDNLGLIKKFSFVSSGGGAMLTFLSDETLVGLDAIKSANHRVPYSPSTKRKGLLARLKDLF